MKSLSSAVYGCVFTTRYVCFVYINYSKISFFSLGHVLCLFCLHRNPRSLYLSGSEILTAIPTALPIYRSPSFLETWEAWQLTWFFAKIDQLSMVRHMSQWHVWFSVSITWPYGWWKNILHHAESNRQPHPAHSWKQKTITSTPLGSITTFPFNNIWLVSWRKSEIFRDSNWTDMTCDLL